MAGTTFVTKALAWFFVVVGVLIVVAIAMPDTDRQPEPRGTPHEAVVLAHVCSTAERGVKAHLKAPATASFDCTEVRRNDEGTRFFVKGHVDAQNSFGAMLRKQFAAFVVTPDGSIDQMAVEKVAIE